MCVHRSQKKKVDNSNTLFDSFKFSISLIILVLYLLYKCQHKYNINLKKIFSKRFDNFILFHCQ